MDNLTTVQSLLEQNSLARIQNNRVEMPQFPLWWLKESKRTMDGLREIASHLHGKTEGRKSRQGFVGETTEMEKQIVRNLIDLEQQVYVQNDVLQSLIQIVVSEHESRISQRIKRAFAGAWKKAKNFGNRLWISPVFKVCGGLGTIAFIYSMVIWIIHLLTK